MKKARTSMQKANDAAAKLTSSYAAKKERQRSKEQEVDKDHLMLKGTPLLKPPRRKNDKAAKYMALDDVSNDIETVSSTAD